MKDRRKGFTIVEVLVVVIILGLLAAFVVPGVFKKVGKAKTDIAKSHMAMTIGGALEQFALSCDAYPTTEQGLQALIEAPPELEDKWGPRYLSPKQILDPWGNEYQYIAENGSYQLISFGADGVDGGEGDNEDIIYEP